MSVMRGIAIVALLAWIAGVPSAAPAASSAPPTQDRRHVTKEEFLRLVGPEEYARLLRAAEQAAVVEPFSIERRGHAVFISGPISNELASALEETLLDLTVTELWIRSGGGDVEAGHRMGRRIRERNLKVVVDQYCISSCANYIFTAGAKRVLPDGAYVVWHGNAQQKDGREFERCGRTVSSFDGLVMLPEEIAEAKKDAEGIARRRAQDLAFFRFVGVDDYIARAGQEPHFYGNFTLSVAGMARLGLKNVDAPDDYASPQFCERVNRQRPTLGLHCIALTDQMLAYERARRAKGEVCQPDRTLRIRTERD